MCVYSGCGCFSFLCVFFFFAAVQSSWQRLSKLFSHEKLSFRSPVRGWWNVSTEWHAISEVFFLSISCHLFCLEKFRILWWKALFFTHLFYSGQSGIVWLGQSTNAPGVKSIRNLVTTMHFRRWDWFKLDCPVSQLQCRPTCGSSWDCADVT